MLHYKVCGTILGLSWLFASVAHKSLPDLPDDLEETDFNARQVCLSPFFACLLNVSNILYMNEYITCVKVIETLKNVVDLGARPVGSPANLQAVKIIRHSCLSLSCCKICHGNY